MKRTALSCLLLALCLLVCACGQKAATNEPAQPCDTVADAIAAAQPIEEMTPLSEEQVLKYLDFTEDLLADFAMRIDASRATAEMIVVLTADNADGLKLLEKALATYRDATLEQYRDYRPDEVPKLEAAVMKTRGLQTTLIVSPDAVAAENALDEAWKQEAK